MKIRHLSTLLLLSCLAGCTGTDYSACYVYQNNQPEQAFKVLESLAAQGDADAQFMLGRMYELWEGVDQDIQQAISWYQKAAEQQHSCALNNLAVRYKTGDQVPEDHQLAFKLTQQAAQSQHPVVLTSFGEMYYFGQGTSVDKDRAYHYYQKALEKGYAGALFQIGRMYVERNKTPQEKLQGLIWLFVFELWQKDNSLKLKGKVSFSVQEFKRYIDKTRKESSPTLVAKAYDEADRWYKVNKHTLLTRKELLQQCCANR